MSTLMSRLRRFGQLPYPRERRALLTPCSRGKLMPSQPRSETMYFTVSTATPSMPGYRLVKMIRPNGDRATCSPASATCPFTGWATHLQAGQDVVHVEYLKERPDLKILDDSSCKDQRTWHDAREL